MKPNNTPPMDAMLKSAAGRVRFHMPGHKGLLLASDMTELSTTDNLYAPISGIAGAERLAAASCGAKHTIMLTGGSTAGLLAMILASVTPGSKIILSRDAHHAALSACVLGDLNPILADDVSEALRSHPDAEAVLVTRPDYFGVCMALPPVIDLAHGLGIKVLVDEAHGAHFPWWDYPESAGRLGADAWVQSAHKTLPALTGAAWLHLSDTMDESRVRRFLRMVQTSSPPFPILQSLDRARAFMDAKGPGALRALSEMLADFRGRLPSLGGYRDIPGDDPTRLVIETLGRGYSGWEAQRLLSAQRVEVEMADDARIVCICTVADTKAAFECLYTALRNLPQREPLPPPPGQPAPAKAERVMRVRQAVFSPQESVPLHSVSGRIAAACVGLYPPGVPWLLPGERVSAECAERLSALPAQNRFGIEDNAMICVR